MKNVATVQKAMPNGLQTIAKRFSGLLTVIYFLGLATLSSGKYASLHDRLSQSKRDPSSPCHLRCASDFSKVGRLKNFEVLKLKNQYMVEFLSRHASKRRSYKCFNWGCRDFSKWMKTFSFQRFTTSNFFISWITRRVKNSLFYEFSNRVKILKDSRMALN